MSRKTFLISLALGGILSGCTPNSEPNTVQTQDQARRAAGREAVASGTPAPIQGEGPSAAEAGETPTVRATP